MTAEAENHSPVIPKVSFKNDKLCFSTPTRKIFYEETPESFLKWNKTLMKESLTKYLQVSKIDMKKTLVLLKELSMSVTEKQETLSSPSDKYFEKGKYSGRFIPQKLAEDLMQETTFITCNDNGDIYYYDENEGIWRSNAEHLIKKLGTTLLKEETKRSYLLETISYIQAQTYIDRKMFDSPPLNLVPLKNGVLDLETRTLKPYLREYYFTSKLPIIYNPDAKCPKINKFIGEIVSESDKELLYEIPAYCLYRGYPIQKAFMLVGVGANGKSTYLQLIIAILGKENVSAITLQTLEANRFAGAQLYKKLANIAADLPSLSLKSTGLFKALTGGDAICGEKKFKDAFFFYNIAKLLFSANQVPFTEDESEAYYRRWIVIIFPNKFEGENANKFILKEITTEEELSGFFNEMLNRYDNIFSKGDFSYTKTTTETKKIYIEKSDSVGAFVTEKVVQKSEESISKEKLYNAYFNYCKTKNLPPMDKGVFSKHLRKYVETEEYNPTIDGKQVHSWRGIQLITNSA